jgi:hypothetical protein
MSTIYIYIYIKTSIKRNILTIKQNIYMEIGRDMDLSAPLCVCNEVRLLRNSLCVVL